MTIRHIHIERSSVCKRTPPPPQGEARSGGGTGWGWAILLMNQKPIFHVCCSHPNFLSCFASNACRCASKCLSQFARAVPVSHGRGSRSAAVAVTIAGISAAACHLHTHRVLKCMLVTYTSSAQVYVNGDGHSVRRRAPCNLVDRAFMPDVFCCRP